MKTVFCVLLLFAFTSYNTGLSHEKLEKRDANPDLRILQWEYIGPHFSGGRITDVESYVRDSGKILAATALGGVWITKNDGNTWAPIFEDQSSTSIGDIAVSQTDDNLLWVGTGEANCSRSTHKGSGIFKSTDRGKTWQNMGLTDSYHIARIIIDPEKNSTVYVAVLGHLYSRNDQRGIFKTTDSGKTWRKILFVDSRTGFVDLVMHPKNPQILYAASWEKDKKPWNFIEGGEKSSIYKTTDGGKTWRKIAQGLPQNKFIGRIGLAISPSNPEVLYALVDNHTDKESLKKTAKITELNLNTLLNMTREDFLGLSAKTLRAFLTNYKFSKVYTPTLIREFVASGKLTPKSIAMIISDAEERRLNPYILGAEVYRSSNGGKSWSKVNQHFLSSIYFTFGFYFGQIRVSPDNENIVYIMGISTLKSRDGGKTFTDISSQKDTNNRRIIHVDSHAMWIDPRNPEKVILGTDGGLNITYDGGKLWKRITGFPMAQCYKIDIDNRKPYNILAGLQDNGVLRIPRIKAAPGRINWSRLLPNDGAFISVHKNNPEIIFAAYQFGEIYRLDLQQRKRTRIKPKSPELTSSYRFNWLTPFLVSRHTPDTLYLGTNMILKSTNNGNSWTEISPDLSDQKNIYGNIPYGTITALAESPFGPDILYAGTDDGNLWTTLNAGKQWIKIGNILPRRQVTSIIPSMHGKERVYVTMSGRHHDDFKTYVFSSENGGRDWMFIRGEIEDEPANVIREFPGNPEVLFLGTNKNIYLSRDRGESWESIRGKSPITAVYDIKYHAGEKELIIGTHSRGIYILSLKSLYNQLISD